MNLKILLPGLLTMYLHALAAQNPITYGLYASTGLAGQKLEAPGVDAGITEKAGPSWNFATGLLIKYQAGKRVFLRSGANIQLQKHLYRLENLKFATDLINGTESQQDRKFSNWSLGIPMDIGFLIAPSSNKLQFYFGMGGQLQIPVSARYQNTVYHELIPDETLSNESMKLKQSTISFGVFGGMSWLLGSKMSLSIEPYARYSPDTYYYNATSARSKRQLEGGLRLLVSNG